MSDDSNFAILNTKLESIEYSIRVLHEKYVELMAKYQENLKTLEELSHGVGRKRRRMEVGI
jgi:hypothetical protein